MTVEKILTPKNMTLRMIDGSTIKGKVNQGLEERLSDLFTSKGEVPLLIVFDLKVGGQKGKCRFVNKQHIIWAEEDFEVG